MTHAILPIEHAIPFYRDIIPGMNRRIVFLIRYSLHGSAYRFFPRSQWVCGWRNDLPDISKDFFVRYLLAPRVYENLSLQHDPFLWRYFGIVQEATHESGQLI
jgi:hypothetical protein